MKKYIGVKLIEAEPETKVKVNAKGLRYDVDNPSEGYRVVYEDGYESWSPKDVFEKAYKEIKTLDFKCKFDGEGQEYKTRVYNEAVELELKCIKLSEFITNNALFPKLHVEEQQRLKQQLMAMQYYLTILIERIENFK